MMSPTISPPSGVDLAGIDPAVYRRRYAILASMCLSLVLIVATVSSVNVAIPKLSESDLRPTATQILWIVDAYALVFAALLLPAGAIGDKFGRKGALLTGLTIFAAASALCGATSSATVLIALRGVMGVGAALIMPSTLSLLQASFPPGERAKAIATWSGFAGAGGAIGPLLGGTLLEHFWFGSVFLVAAPLALIAFIASATLAPRSKEAESTPLDPIGALLSIIGFAALLFAIIEGPDKGWSHGLVIGSFVAAAIALGGFVTWERRAAHPMLDMRFFRIPRFAAGSLGVTMTFMVMFAMFFVLTQYLQFVRGYSPLAAGVRGLPFAIGMILVSPRSPKLVAALGGRTVVRCGLAIVALGLLAFSLATSSTPYVVIALILFTTACGVSLAMPTLSIGILQSVPMSKAGVGSAVNDTTRELGGAIGIAVIGSIINSVYRDRAGDVLDALPPQAAEAARLNVGAAIKISESPQLPAGVGTSLADTVRAAFLDGAQIGLRVAVGVVAIAAVVVPAMLPRDRAATPK